MTMPKKIWIGAVGGAMGVHLGIAALMLADPPESGAQNVGIQGIEIGLGAAGGLAGEQTESAEFVNEAKETEQVEEKEDIEEITEPPEAPPVEQVTETIEPTETQESVPEPVEIPDILPEPAQEVIAPEPPEIIAELAAVEDIADEVPVTEPPAPEIIEDLPEIIQKVTSVPRRKPQPPRPIPPEPPPLPEPEPEPEPEPTPVSAPAPVVADPGPAPVAPPAPQASLQGSRGVTGAGTTQNIGSGTHASAGGSPGMMRDYTAYLQAWLERHKEYPRRARLRRQQGTAILHFEVNRDGIVLSYEIRESSGYRLLDDEVAKMIKRAQPLPKFPVEMARASLNILVPVSFAIQ